MKRLVYSPKVWAYIKGRPDPTTGVPALYDISPYIVSGEVLRRTNAVSSAEITIRNPNRVFTQLGNPAFLPMDPITIFLQRHVNKPVRVFTGWLDDSPYYQMYPGTCSLAASCTLKKLQYTFWDPALPFVMSFLKDIGWAVDTANGMLINPANYAGGPVVKGDISKVKLNDGGFGQLLYAIMTNVGGWDDSNIHIENLPASLVPWVTSMFKKFQVNEAAAKADLESLLGQIIGGGGGSGGGTGGTGSGGSTSFSGSVSGSAQIIGTICQVANGAGIPPAFAVAVACVEVGSPGQLNSEGAGVGTGGWYQWKNPTPYGNAVDMNKVDDLGYACSVFCNAAKAKQTQYGSDWQQWAIYTQGVESNLSGNTRYSDSAQWGQFVAGAKLLVAKYCGGNSNVSVSPGGSPASQGPGFNSNVTTPSGYGLPAGGSSTKTVYSAIVEGANAIDSAKLTYVWGGGHSQAGQTTGGGFDCSGAVAAVLAGASLYSGSVGRDDSFVASLVQSGTLVPGTDNGPSIQKVNVYDNPGVHIFMEIGGRFWGTWAGGTSTAGGGGWCPNGNTSGFKAYHVPQNILLQNGTYKGSVGSGGNTTLPGSSGTGAGVGGSSTDPFVIAKATAFASQLQWPSIADTIEAVALQGHKALMNDQPLLNFVTQVCGATMRSFQSAPNGDFYAFFPDYFGEFGHNDPYWHIDDVEIITGDIQLTDSTLVTHMYVVGDTLMANEFPNASTQLLEKVLSAGTVDIFDYFGSTLDSGSGGLQIGSNLTKYIDGGKGGTTAPNYAGSKTGGYTDKINITRSLHSNAGGYAFLNRYGARPVELDQPLIRSQFFEAFIAIQQFMLAWSSQFATDFTFTFMPELYPGGRVNFSKPDNINMYINGVTHTFDYENGFTTVAELTAPSAGGVDDGTPEYNSPSWGMVNSIR